MNREVDRPAHACITPGVEPLLSDLPSAIQADYCGADDPRRAVLEGFIGDTFRRAYGAELSAFYPNLTAFRCEGELRGVVGYRDGMVKPLFSEHYLDAPVETVISAHLGETIERQRLVEVGNLALAESGDARWLIAAATAFLHAAGYRWVLFTAVRPLFNAFQRLGLRPIVIAAPDPARLPDGGRNWGSYYQAGPLVCAGDIEAGYRKLSQHVGARNPRLQILLHTVRRLGIASRYAGGGIREAV